MSSVAQFLALAAIDVAGLFAIWFILRARVRRFLELESLLSGVREEARALVTELNETADRNVSLVEDRMASLRALLDEADRRIGLAKRELAGRAAEREVYARLNKRRPIVPGGAEPDIPAAPSRAAPSADAAEGTADGESAAAARADADSAAEAPEGPPPESFPEVTISKERVRPEKSPRERALELHRSGFSAQIIAARIGATVAEVELMIEMEERRPASR